MRIVTVAALALACSGAFAQASAPDAVLLLVTSPGNELVTTLADGTGRTTLGTGAVQATWSPDGSRVAYVAAGSLRVVGADGSDPHVAFPVEPADRLFSSSWSGDGGSIAFVLVLADGTYDIWVVGADGRSSRRLTGDGIVKSGVAWSPTSARLLVDAGALSASTISILDPVSGSRTKLADGAAAVWSPDGSRIAYLDSQARLAVMRGDGSRNRVLATSVYRPPTWSADGTTLFFAQQTTLGPTTKFGPPMRSDVFSVPADGDSPPKRLTGAPPPGERSIDLEDGRAPAPSFDVTQVFYLRYASVGTGLSELWHMNADGTCRRPEPGLANVLDGPLWRPGRSFGGPVECVGVRVYAIPDQYAPIDGRGKVRVVVWNNGNEPATGVLLAVTTSGGAPGGARCHPGCAIGTLAAGASASLSVDAPTGTPGTLRFVVRATGDQPNIDPGGAQVQTSVQILPCTIVGSDGPDRLVGGPAPDRICGKPGRDWISGGAGDDYIDAGNGSDTVLAGRGHDTVLGRGGADTIFARDGQRDWIDCGTEYDVAVVDRLDHVHHCERVLRR